MRSADNLNCQAPRMSLEPVFSCARVPCHRAPMAFAPFSVARRPPSPHSICAPEISTGKFRPVIHKRVPFKSVEPAIAAVQGKKPSCQRRCNSAEPSSFHRSEEHTSELQSQSNLVCRLLLEKKKKIYELQSQHNDECPRLLYRAQLSPARPTRARPVSPPGYRPRPGSAGS